CSLSTCRPLRPREVHRLHPPSSFTDDAGLRTRPEGLGTSHIPRSDSIVGKLDFGASLRFSFVTTCRLACPPVGADQVFTQPTRTFTAGLPTDWSPAPPPAITTGATGQVPLVGLSPTRTSTSIAATSPGVARSAARTTGDGLAVIRQHPTS